jgi:hypothetical protein
MFRHSSDNRGRFDRSWRHIAITLLSRVWTVSRRLRGRRCELSAQDSLSRLLNLPKPRPFRLMLRKRSRATTRDGGRPLREIHQASALALPDRDMHFNSVIHINGKGRTHRLTLQQSLQEEPEPMATIMVTNFEAGPRPAATTAKRSGVSLDQLSRPYLPPS